MNRGSEMYSSLQTTSQIYQAAFNGADWSGQLVAYARRYFRAADRMR